MKSKFFKNCLALLLITLVAGFALASVNEITSEPITKAENQARLDAYKAVFPDAQFMDMENVSDIISRSESPDNKYNANAYDVLKAVDSEGNTIGYVMSVVTPLGYGGDIKIALGISLQDERITGFSVLSNSETAGLGAKCSEEAFSSQFAGKSAFSDIAFVKSGGASTDSEIDAISGATITTNAVTEAVNAGIWLYNDILKEG